MPRGAAVSARQATMFLIRWTTMLLSLPLVWAGRLCAALQMPIGTALLKAAWLVNGDGETARLALSHVRRAEGLASAREHARRWLARRPRPEVAAYAGLFALEAGDRPAARELLDAGRQLGDDPAGMFELLELMLAAHEDNPLAVRDAAARLVERRDLAPVVSRMVHSELLWDAMLAGRFDEARGRAAHLLAVADDGPAEVALWALARHGRDPSAHAHLQRASRMAPDQRVYYMLLGALSIGQVDEAREMLPTLRERNAGLARNAEQLLGAGEGGRWT